MASAIKFTDSVAESYEKYRGTIFFEPYAKDMAERLTKGNIKSILEIACGTGQVTRLLRAKLPGARIVATDLNPSMIDVAKKIVSEQDKIEWMLADAQVIPFDENSFDAIICQFGLMFVPDKQRAVNEAYRVLKPGGRFIFSTWDTIQNNSINNITQEIVNSFFDGDPVTFWEVPFSMYNPQELEKLMANAGFKNISVQNVLRQGYSPSVHDATTGITVGSPAHLSIMERGPEKLPEIQNKVKEAFIKEYGEKDLKVPLSALVAEGVK